jgi:flavin reductase (DIM6/NTAB) family NADH-FMN oxidoreductase RutF
MLFDFETISPRDRYKLLVSTVVPRPIAWVVTQDPGGLLNAAPYSFFNVFSGDPPLVIIGIGGREPGDAKDTGANIRRSQQFVVNLVGHGNAEPMNVTAIDLAPEIDEIAQAGLHTLPSHRVAPPRIAESPVALECERFAAIEVGADRVLIIGRVVAMHVRDEAVIDHAKCYIDTPKLDLIGRMHGAGWYARTTDLFELPRIPVEDWNVR